MKHLLTVIVSFAFLACASGDAPNQNVRLNEPDLHIVQITGPADQKFPTGYIQVQYGMRIGNRSGETITLRQLDLESMGGGGPYRLRRETYYFNIPIAADQFHDFAFWANAYSTGNWRSVDAYAPVSIRGVAHFDSPAGRVRKIFVKVIPQDRSRRGE